MDLQLALHPSYGGQHIVAGGQFPIIFCLLTERRRSPTLKKSFKRYGLPTTAFISRLHEFGA